jgi:hypothetical protein
VGTRRLTAALCPPYDFRKRGGTTFALFLAARESCNDQAELRPVPEAETIG